jgi:hypothetical protein
VVISCAPAMLDIERAAVTMKARGARRRMNVLREGITLERATTWG